MIKTYGQLSEHSGSILTWPVIPAKVGIQKMDDRVGWMPASAAHDEKNTPIHQSSLKILLSSLGMIAECMSQCGKCQMSG
jgi:hypothetical protein